MRRAVLALAVLAALPPAARAADELGARRERTERFEAKVVSLACEVAGVCPPACGGGRHQLGLLRDDGRLVPVVKNYDHFAGAVDDLLPFCGRRVVADGLMIDHPRMPVFMLQFKKAADGGRWSRANWFYRDWSKANGEAPGREWFRRDDRVRAEIGRTGVLGIPGLRPPPE